MQSIYYIFKKIKKQYLESNLDCNAKNINKKESLQIKNPNS